MLQKSKLIVFVSSLVIVLYAVSAAFYGKVVAKDEAYKELSVFMDALEKIGKDYVEAPDMSKVQEGAMRGLMESLDPHSTFLSKDQLKELEKRKAAGTAGVGMIVSKRGDVIYVLAVHKGGPSDKAGLRPGDYLMMIDGVSVEDRSIIEADAFLRGASGSTVKLTVFRSSRTKPIELSLVRETDSPVPVGSQMLAGNVGVLDVSSLADSTIDQVHVKLKTLISAGAEKLILDLRDCADGSIADGAQLANFFIREGVLTYTKNKQGQTAEELKASPSRFISDLPLVVLINGSTAGAAEVASGALKDSKRASIVGEKSFGSGSSQRQILLKSGAALILSVAKYYTPSGKIIQDEVPRNAGIKPDVQSPDDERRQDLLVDAYYDGQQDDTAKYKQLVDKISREQMDKALEVLSKMQVPMKKAA